MLRRLILLSAFVLLAACGDDQAPPPAKTEAAAPPASSAAPAPAATASTGSMPAEMGEAMDDDEVVYDPIDVSKLETSWWKQYSTGS